MFGSFRIFTPKTLVSEIVEASGLDLVQPLDTTLRVTTNNVIEQRGRGRFTSTTGSEYPYVAVRARRFGFRTQRWTSAALAMSKPSH
jgi:hypothetical protein